MQVSIPGGARRWFIAGVMATAVSVSSLALAAGTEGDLRGYWKPESFIATVKTVDGKIPPMTPKAAELYNSRVAARKAGKVKDPLDECLPAGTPRAMYQMRPFLLAQTPVKVTLVHEFEHLIRNVYLDEPLKTDDPVWQGYSVGHWDNGTLVIETAGFNGKTWIDEAGLPMSEKTKVTERLSRTGKTTMVDEIRIEDPDLYTQPWTTRVSFAQVPNGDLGVHVCTEKIFPMPPNARPKPPAQ